MHATAILTLCAVAGALPATPQGRDVAPTPAASPWVSYAGKDGPGHGKTIVFVAGDEEYRSEEACPMLARLLAERHGFTCTVLFAQDPDTGVIDPDEQSYLPGLEQLDDADLLVLFTRFRELPDEAMAHVDAYVRSGKPILGLRTATHAFRYQRRPDSPFARYDWQSTTWPGGFGRQVLGETWVAHHGAHGRESTAGVVDPAHDDHPILRGVHDVWGPTDVYAVRDLPEDAAVLLRGRILQGMTPDAAPLTGPKNDPMMPIAWTRAFTTPDGDAARVFCTTMGAAQDFANEGLRRLVVNACYWAVGLEDAIEPDADVRIVGDYDPSPFGFGGYRKGVRPADLVGGDAPREPKAK